MYRKVIVILTLCLVLAGCNRSVDDSSSKVSSSKVSSSKESGSEATSVGEVESSETQTSSDNSSAAANGSSSYNDDVSDLPPASSSSTRSRPSPPSSMPSEPEDIKSYVTAGYKLVWGDEFDGNKLDSNKWKQGFGHMIPQGDLILLADDPRVCRVEDGLLKMDVIHYYDPANSVIEYATSCSVETQDTMNYLYGYLEFRAKVPYKIGTWSSVWMKSTGTLGIRKALDYFIEIDLFEIFSSTDTAYPHLHKWFPDGSATESKIQNNYTFQNNFNLANEFHVYGMEWTPDEISMYVNGEKYTTYDLSYNFDGLSDMKGFHDPIHLLLDNHIFTNFSSWVPMDSGTVINTQLPYEFHFDYIRLYQKPGVGALYTK